MNKNLIKFAAIFGLTAVVAHAQFASNIGVTSNYVWRGMTYSDDSAAVFGGLDFSSESGFYAGTWLSSMDAAEPDADSLGGNTEVDLYAGFSGETGSTEYDIGVIRYSYLDTANDDYYELYGSLTFSGLTIGGAYTIESQATDDADDGTAGSQDTFIEGDVYLYASYSIDLAETIGEGYSLTGTVGQYLWDDDGVESNIDYNHILLELSKDAGDFGTVTLSGSFVSSEFINTGFMDDDDARFFVTWSKEF